MSYYLYQQPFGQKQAQSGVLEDQLSFLSQLDQQRFQQLFQNATNKISISPEAARNILLKSQLPPHHLARIWELSDINKTGDLLFPEFALALHLCNLVLRGGELPYQLDPLIRDEVSRYVDKINFSIPEGSTLTASNHQLKPSTANDIFETRPIASEFLNHPGLQSQSTGYGFQTPVDSGFNSGQLFQNQVSLPPLPQQQNQLLNYQSTGAPQFNQSQQDQSKTSQLSQQVLNGQQNSYDSQKLSQQNQVTGLNLQPWNTSTSSYGLQSLNSQTTGVTSLLNQPQQIFQPQKQPVEETIQTLNSHNTGFNNQAKLSTQPFGYQTTGVNQQARKVQSLNQQTTGFQTQPLTTQTTGHQSQIKPQAAILIPINTQTTGDQPLKQQPTGLIPLKNQTTGLVPLNNQTTGLVPLNNQTTGLVPLDNQTTGLVPLNNQTTGLVPLNNQTTGLVPLNNQTTGSNVIIQQPTALIPTSTGGKIQTHQTGGLQQQLTGLVPLPYQTTGAAGGSIPLKPGHTGGTPLQQQPVKLLPSQSVVIDGASLQSQRTGFDQFEPLRAQKTGVGQNSFFLTTLVQQQAQPPSIPQQQWANSLTYTQEKITPQEKQLFNKIFENYDTDKKGLLNADVSAELFRKSGLNREDLEKVWDLIARPNQTHLDKESFQAGMWLVYKRLNGWELPEKLPESLIPSSLKILDDVKNKLKTGNNVKSVKRSSNSRLDGSRFKNNDDELVPSSARHRRRQKSEVKSPEAGQRLSMDELKKKIWEKKILLEALKADDEKIQQDSKVDEIMDLQKIEELKKKIQELPSASPLNNNEKLQLKTKFNSLTLKVPTLISQISLTNNKIPQLKLELCKIKNPSSTIGTGSNGEITESDIRKAKSKALLASKMAKLTGQPLDLSFAEASDENEKLTEEISNIRQECQKSQKIISDVEELIKEVSNSIISGLKDSNNEDYKKWELGIGVQPEVQEIIKSLRVNDLSNKFARDLSLSSTSSLLSVPSPISQPIPSSSSVSSSRVSTPEPQFQSNQNDSHVSSYSSITSSKPSFQSVEERKAYIKEQARKKIEERMAKFGIRMSSGTPSPVASSSQPSAPVFAPSPTLFPVQQTPPTTTSQAQAENSDSSDDNEEESQRTDKIRRLKKQERDARLSQLESTPAIQECTTTQFHDSNPFAKR